MAQKKDGTPTSKKQSLPGHCDAPTTAVPRDGLGGARPQGAADGQNDGGKFKYTKKEGINK